MTTSGDIVRLRLLSQQIVASHCRSPGEVVHTLGAMQAQDYAAVLCAIGLRLPGSNGMFLPIMVLHGQVVGTWKRTLKKKSVAVLLEPFGKLRKTDLTSFDP